MNAVEKPNDILIATLHKPEASAFDLVKNNINAQNTSLLSKDEYKQTPFVKKYFTQDGVFNEDAFNKAYELAQKKFFDLEDDNLFDEFSKYLEYGETSRYRPFDAKKRDNSYTPEIIKNNPLQQATGIEGINVQSKPVKTPEEAAQSGGIWDPENKKWLEGTAEDRSFGSKLFGQTLVYATYDKDGMQENPITGEIGQHYKGEFITDANGQYFTELLGSRDILDKKVVSVQDILTKEGTTANKLDFFDSDSYEKSVGGVAMKTLAAMAPYTIPGLNTWYGAFTAITGLAAVLPTFYKSMEGVITGDRNTELTKSATALENWFRKFDPSMSRKGQENFFSVEGIGNLLADTFGQLYQQRAAASLSKFLYKIPNAETAGAEAILEATQKRNKAAKALSLGYMGLISVADVYNDALKSGYDKRTAGLASLMSAAALFGIMNYNEGANGLGTWFLDKTTGYDHEITRKPVIQAAKNLYKDIAKDVQTVTASGEMKGLARSLSKYKAQIRNIADDIFRVQGEDIWKNMIVEGVEEVSEEVVQDAVKGVIDTLSWLGYTQKAGSFGGWDNVFSRDGASRYLQTFVGGAIGGGLFSIQQNIIEPTMIRAFKDPHYKSENELLAEKDIMDVILSGRTEELLDELQKCKKIFSDKRASTGMIDENGNLVELKADGQMTQSDMIVDAAIETVKDLDSFAKDYMRGKDFDFTMFAPEVQRAIRDSFRQEFDDMHVMQYVMEKFSKNMTSLYELHKSYVGSQEASKSNKSNEKETPSVDEEIKRADQAVAEQTEEQRGESEANKAAFEKQLAKVRGFFTGKEYIETKKELIKLDALANASGEGAIFKGLSERTFYDYYIKNETFTTPYDQLPSDSANPNVMTKKKVKALWEKYRNEKLTIENLLEQLPMIVKIEDAMMQQSSSDIVDFVDNQHKQEIIKSIKNMDIDTQTMEDFIQQADDEMLFDPDTLRELAGMTEEEKENKRLEAKSRMAQAFMNGSFAHSLRPAQIVGLIQAHKRAWNLSARRKVDYASKLISSGALQISGFNEKQLKVLNDLINTQAIAKRIKFFNASILQDLVNSINVALQDNNNVFTQRIKLLADQESDSAIDTANQLGYVDIGDTSAIDFSEIEQLKLKSLSDYIQGDEFIEESLYNELLDLQKTRLEFKLDSLEQIAVEHNFGNLLRLISKLRDALNQSPIDATRAKTVISNIQSDIINHLKDYIPEVSVNDPEAMALAMPFIEALNLSPITNPDDGTQTFDFSIQVAENLRNDLQGLLDFQSKYEASKVIENPILRAIRKIHFAQTGSDDGMNILDWAIKKSLEVVAGRANADNVSFSSVELESIADAHSTLAFMALMVKDMIGYDATTEDRYGSNQLTVDYLKAWNKGQDLIDKYKLIDAEDAQYILKVIQEADSMLTDLEQISTELRQDKRAKYEKMHTMSLKKQVAFFKTRPKLHIDDDDYELLDESDIDLAEDASAQEQAKFVLACKQKICKKIQELKSDSRITSKITADKNVDQVLMDIFWQSYVNLEDEASRDALFISGRRIEDAINVTDDATNVDTQWWLNELTGMLQIAPKQVRESIAKILRENPTVFPRQDQLEAMERIITWCAGKDNFNYLQEKLKNAYNEYAKDSVPIEERTWEKIALQNTMFLLGSGGAGKTLIASLLKSEYGKYFSGKLYVSAISDKKLADLQTGFGDGFTGIKLHDIFPDFKKLQDQYKQSEETLETFIAKNCGILDREEKPVNDMTYWQGLTDIPTGLTFEQREDGIYAVYQVTDGTNKLFTLTTKLGNNFNSIEVNLEQSPSIVIDKNSLVIIDECTLLSNFEQQVLSKICKENNIATLQIGDSIQQSDIIKYADKRVTFGLRYYQANFAPELFGSWRAENSAVFNNSSEVRNRLATPEESEKIIGLEGDRVQSGWQQPQNTLKPKLEKVELQYTTVNKANGFKFLGTHLTNDSEDIRSIIELINQAPQDKTLAVIINQGDSKDAVKSELAALGLNVENDQIITLQDVQGAEFDYTIGYKLKSSGSIVADAGQAYTEITRGKQGNLVIKAPDHDLFENCGLSKDKNKGSEVTVSARSDASGNESALAELENSIEGLDDVTIVKSVAASSGPIPAKPDEDSDRILNPKSGLATALAGEDDGGEPEPSNSGETFEPGEEGEPGDPQQAAELKNSSVTGKLTQYGFKDFSVSQSWYFYTGVSRDTVRDLRSSNDSKSKPAFDSVLTDATQERPKTELGQFLKVLLTYENSRQPEDDIQIPMGSITISDILASTFGFPSASPLQLRQAVKNLRESKNGAQLLQTFKTFVRVTRNKAGDNATQIVAIKQKYDKLVDWPLDKLNDKDPDRKTIVRYTIPIYYTSGATSMTNYAAITIGTSGYNYYKLPDDSVKTTSETFENEIWGGVADQVVGKEEHFIFDLDTTVTDTSGEDYLAAIRHSGALPQTLYAHGTGIFTQITGLRNLVIDKDNVFNKDFIAKRHLDRSRWSLADLRTYGYELVTQNNLQYIRNANLTIAEQKAEFVKWYSQFRNQPLSAEGKKKLEFFYDQQWLLVRPKGSSEIIPVQVKKIVTLEKSLTTNTASTHVWRKPTAFQGVTNPGSLNMACHRKIASALAFLTTDELKKELNQLYANFLANPNYDKAKEQYTGIALFEDLGNRIQAKLPDSINKTMFDNFWKSFIASINWKSAYDSGIIDGSNDTLKSNAFKKHFDHIVNKHEFDIAGGWLKQLVVQLDQDLPSFFYENDPTVNPSSLTAMTSGDYVIEIGYEDANLVINFNKLKRHKAKRAPGVVRNPLPHNPVVVDVDGDEISLFDSVEGEHPVGSVIWAYYDKDKQYFPEKLVGYTQDGDYVMESLDKRGTFVVWNPDDYDSGEDTWYTSEDEMSNEPPTKNNGEGDGDDYEADEKVETYDHLFEMIKTDNNNSPLGNKPYENLIWCIESGKQLGNPRSVDASIFELLNTLSRIYDGDGLPAGWTNTSKQTQAMLELLKFLGDKNNLKHVDCEALIRPIKSSIEQWFSSDEDYAIGEQSLDELLKPALEAMEDELSKCEAPF